MTHSTSTVFSVGRSRRAFSLIEVLLAVFILGVGVISIAALFPAGIAQQRLSVDDYMGPVVAENALALIRSKVRPDDFGFLVGTSGAHPTVQGDFPWSRPAFIFGNTPAQSGVNIFEDADTVTEVRYNTVKYDDPSTPGVFDPSPPKVIITQGERYYPMSPIIDPSPTTPLSGDEYFADERLAKPEYVWDCMFRKFQGKVLVAIFVYRPTIPGGGALSYSVPREPPPAPPTQAVMPFKLGLVPGGNFQINTGGGSFDKPIIGTPAGEIYNPDERIQAWQEPRQWLLDQNNNIHRVVSAWREAPDKPMHIQFVRPVAMPPWLIDNDAETGTPKSPFFIPYQSGASVVSSLFYIPVRVELDTNNDGAFDTPVNLTPVYVTVKEL